MKRKSKRFWSCLLTAAMVVAGSGGAAKPTSVYASGGGDNSSVSSEVLVDAATSASVTYAGLDTSWLSGYDTFYIHYAYSDSSKYGWGPGAIQLGQDPWTAYVSLTGAGQKEVTETVAVSQILEGAEKDSVEKLPPLALSLWSSAYLLDISASTGSGEKVVLKDSGKSLGSTAFDAGWFDTYDSVTINYSYTGSGKQGWKVGAIQAGGTSYVQLPLTSNDADGISSYTITEAELLEAADVSSRADLPELSVGVWDFSDGGSGYIISILGNKASAEPEEPTPTPDTDDPAAVTDTLELDKVYSGTQVLKLDENKKAHEASFTVSDPDIKAGDIYQIKLTLSGAGNYKQAALQGSHNSWDWGSGIEEDPDSFKTWEGNGIGDGWSGTFRIGVTNSSLSGSFQFKLRFDNMIQENEEEEISIQIIDLKVTKESVEQEEPVPGETKPIGYNLDLNTVYTGTQELSMDKTSYGAYFSVSDPKMAAGDIYKIELALSGISNFKQIAVQGDYASWDWGNGIEDDPDAFKAWSSEGFTGERTFTFRIKVTNSSLSGAYTLKLHLDSMIETDDLPEKMEVSISKLKITKEGEAEATPTPTTGASSDDGSGGGSSSGGSSSTTPDTDDPAPTPTPVPTSTPTPEPTSAPEPTKAEGTNPGGTKKTQKIVREIKTTGTVEVTKTSELNKVLDSNNDNGKMYQLPMQQYADNGKLKKIVVTITFDQRESKGYVGGSGGIGYSTDGEWQDVSFEHAFVDGEVNTTTIVVEIPDGVNPTFDSGSIVQVGWWWGSTSSITVDKIDFIFEQEGESISTVEIEVSENPVVMATKPGSFEVSLSEYVKEIAKVDSVVLRVAATGRFKAAVYAAVAEGEIPLMADTQVKIGEISMDADGYQSFTLGGLAGTLTGDITIEIIEIEEGATAVVDGIILMGADDEEIGAVGEIPEDEEGPEEPGDPADEPDEPEEPEDPADEPEDPADGPEDPEDPADEPDGSAEEPRDADDGDSTEMPSDLPKTGRMDSRYFYFLGIALCFAGIMILKKRGRKEV